MIKKWNDLNLGAKWTFTYAFLILTVSGSIMLGVYLRLSTIQRQTLRERLYDIVSFSIPLVDGDYHSLITAQKDEASPFYYVVNLRLQAIQNTSKVIQRIYTLRLQDDGQLTYVVDAKKNPEHHVGAIYHQNNPELAASLKNISGPIINDEIITDEEGAYLSGYAPIYDQFGELDGILGIDIDASSVTDNEISVRRLAILSLLATIPLALFIGWRIAHYFTSPIQDLVKGAEQVSQGKLDQLVPVRSQDELGLLANAFNQMTEKLRHTMGGLEQEIRKYQRAEKVQDVIYRISQTVTSTNTIDEMYHSIHTILGELIPVDNFYIALYNPTSDMISFPYFIDKYNAPPEERKKGKGLTEYIMQMESPLLLTHEDFDHLLSHGAAEPRGKKPIDWLGAPLIVEGRTLGVVTVQSYSEKIRFNQETLNLMEFISTQIALAIEHKTAAELLQNSNERYRILFENSPISLWEEDFSAIKRIVDELKNQGVTDIRAHLSIHPEIIVQCAAEVRIVDVNQATLELFGAKSKEDMLSNLSNIFTDETYTLFKDEICYIADGLTEFNWEGVNQTLDGKSIDISIKWSVVPGHENDLSKVIISMIDITKRRMTEKKLLYISSHDALTGLYNRAYFDEEMARLDHSRQFPISVIMVDVDKLKRVNDSRGHLAGDTMLQKAASVLNTVFRAEDVVARIGGDEFAILLPNINAKGAEKTIERIRENVKHQNAADHDSPFSLSIGVSTAEQPGTLCTALFEADENMYLDKTSKPEIDRSKKA